MNIYVGNLSYEVTSDDLREAFGGFGQVAVANVIMDRQTGKSKGFGFVDMANQTEAQAAIAGLNGSDLKGRKLNVSEARPKTERSPGSERGGR